MENLKGPGEKLRIAREAKQLTISQVAQKLRLTTQQISAIESDNYGDNSRFIFSRGYLRMYAKLLGISINETMKAFDNLRLSERKSEYIAPVLLEDDSLIVKKPHRSSKMLWWITASIIILILIFSVLGLHTVEKKRQLNKTSQPLQPVPPSKVTIPLMSSDSQTMQLNIPPQAQ